MFTCSLTFIYINIERTTGEEFSLDSLLNDCDDDEINNNDIRRSRRSIPPALYPTNSSLNHYKNYSVSTDMDTSASRHYNRLFHHNPHPNEPPSIEWHSANIDIRDFYDPYERGTLGDYSSVGAGQNVNAKTKLSHDRQIKHGSRNFNYNSLNAERKYRHASNSGGPQLISRNTHHPPRYPPQIVNPYELKQPFSHAVRIRSTEKHLSPVKVKPIQPGQASSFSSQSSGSPFRTVYVSSELFSERPKIDTRPKPEPHALSPVVDEFGVLQGYAFSQESIPSTALVNSNHQTFKRNSLEKFSIGNQRLNPIYTNSFRYDVDLNQQRFHTLNGQSIRNQQKIVQRTPLNSKERFAQFNFKHGSGKPGAHSEKPLTELFHEELDFPLPEYEGQSFDRQEPLRGRKPNHGMVSQKVTVNQLFNSTKKPQASNEKSNKKNNHQTFQRNKFPGQVLKDASDRRTKAPLFETSTKRRTVPPRKTVKHGSSLPKFPSKPISFKARQPLITRNSTPRNRPTETTTASTNTFTMPPFKKPSNHGGKNTHSNRSPFAPSHARIPGTARQPELMRLRRPTFDSSKSTDGTDNRDNQPKRMRYLDIKFDNLYDLLSLSN